MLCVMLERSLVKERWIALSCCSCRQGVRSSAGVRFDCRNTDRHADLRNSVHLLQFTPTRAGNGLACAIATPRSSENILGGSVMF